jgi:hypothetical protein
VKAKSLFAQTLQRFNVQDHKTLQRLRHRL